METSSSELPEVVLIAPRVVKDERGFFLETFHAQKLAGSGVPDRFVQDNHSHSIRGTLRGMHGQMARPQGKLIRVTSGQIFDVAVDVRRGSPRFGRWVGVILSADNYREMYIPPGFLHGFCALSETADVSYKCTDYYDAKDEFGVRWNDPQLQIKWPIQTPLLSKKDALLPLLSELNDKLPVYKSPELDDL